MNRYKEFFQDENNGINSIDNSNAVIEEIMELRNRGAITICPRKLIIFILTLIALSLAAGYSWRSIETVYHDQTSADQIVSP
jgi:hypothetical protein